MAISKLVVLAAIQKRERHGMHRWKIFVKVPMIWCFNIISVDSSRSKCGGTFCILVIL